MKISVYLQLLTVEEVVVELNWMQLKSCLPRYDFPQQIPLYLQTVCGGRGTHLTERKIHRKCFG